MNLFGGPPLVQGSQPCAVTARPRPPSEARFMYKEGGERNLRCPNSLRTTNWLAGNRATSVRIWCLPKWLIDPRCLPRGTRALLIFGVTSHYRRLPGRNSSGVRSAQADPCVGPNWTTVLCPYIGEAANIEAPGFQGLTIDKRGVVWVGSVVYGEPSAPWEHVGPVWVVDQERKTRGNGPPMAALFAFDGIGWQAFGLPNGLPLQEHQGATPKLDVDGRIVLNASGGDCVREGARWRHTQQVDEFAGKRWILRERQKGLSGGYSQLLYREGQLLVEVRPNDHNTGKLLDIRSEWLRSLCIAEDSESGSLWLGTAHGLYRIWAIQP